MRKKTPTLCGKCGGNTKPFVLFANATTGESYQLCANCMSDQSASSLNDLAELDALIEEHEYMVKELEEMVKEAGDMKIPPELEAFAFTPMKTYKMAQMTLASLKSKRLKLLTQEDNEEQLTYELKKKIEEEHYEEAGAIQKRLTALNSKKKNKKKAKKKKSKKSSTLFASDEAAAGRCINCQKNFPKPPGLFSSHDIGDCHQMCLPCCRTEILPHVKTIEMADQMLSEIERFSELMDSLSFLGKMAQEEESPVDSDIEAATEEATTFSPAQGMTAALKHRRDFLSGVQENTKMINVADGLIAMLNDFNKPGPNGINNLESMFIDLLKEINTLKRKDGKSE